MTNQDLRTNKPAGMPSSYNVVSKKRQETDCVGGTHLAGLPSNDQKTSCRSMFQTYKPKLPNVVILSQQAQLEMIPISLMPYRNVIRIVKEVTDCRYLHQRLCFDKIGLWEQVTDSIKESQEKALNIKSFFDQFRLNERIILDKPKVGKKRGGICTEHAIWVQHELKKKGVSAYVVEKWMPDRPNFNAWASHAALQPIN